MQNKLFAIMITALLIMGFMAGSAMCATYDSSVTLENKDVHWNVLDKDAFIATIDYNASGDEFTWHAYGVVPLKGECYALIYYADKPNRNVNWGGNNPGAMICDTISPDVCTGEFDVSGVIDLGMNMPESPDYNIAPAPSDEYCNPETDNFDHCCGAKLWMVPCDILPKPYPGPNPGNGGWAPPPTAASCQPNILFETDLIWYDDTDHNMTPIVVNAHTDEDWYEAGEEIIFDVTVCDYDGVADLESMTVTVNLSDYGIEEPIVLTHNYTFDCTCADYIGSAVVTEVGEMCGEVLATDPSGEISEDDEVCFFVYPGPCAQLVIEGPDKALTRKSFCQGFNDESYAVYLEVTCEDECGNPTDNCDCDLEATATGSASVFWRQNDEWMIRVSNFDQPETVTINAHCVCDPDVESGSHDITFLNPIEELVVTSDPGFLYEMNDCSEDRDCVNINAQLVDDSGEPIPMPGVWTQFIIDGCWYGEEVETDDNGTATIELCMIWEYDESIDVLAVAICREGTMTIDIVEPVLYAVEVEAPEVMTCGGEPAELEYVCYSDHDTEMCCPECPPTIWSCDELGEIDEDGYFTALDSGTAIVEVNVSGVIGTAEIVIDCSENCTEKPNQCQTYPYSFVVTSGSVSLSGNFTEAGYACLTAVGDPISDWDNDTRGAIVEMSDDATEDVMLDLVGDGDTWRKNGTTGNWSKYADGAVSEVSSGKYALVTPNDPVCTDVTIGPVGPFDIYVGNAITFSVSCVDQFGDDIECSDLTWHSDNVTVGEVIGGIFEGYAPGVAYVTAEGCGTSNSVQVNVTANPDPEPTPTETRRSSSRGGGGTYPPDPTPTPDVDDSTDNETDQDDPKPAATKTADVKPTVNLPGGDTTLATTPDDEAPGGTDPTNAILVVLGILALIVIGYVLYRKSQQ